MEAAKSSLVTAQAELQHLAEMAADVARSEQIAALTEERDGGDGGDSVVILASYSDRKRGGIWKVFTTVFKLLGSILLQLVV